MDINDTCKIEAKDNTITVTFPEGTKCTGSCPAVAALEWICKIKDAGRAVTELCKRIG
jgi:hypothetical protein